MKTITIPTANINCTVSDDWQDMPPAPEQSPGTLTFNIIGQSYRGAMAVQAIELNTAMPFGQDENVIATIHERGIDDQSGLLAIKSVTSPRGVQFVYSLFKRLIPHDKGGGVMYTLTIHIGGDNTAYQIQSMIGEYGMTGMRDSVVLPQMLSQGKVTMVPEREGQQPKLQGWSSDPYDPNFTKGVPMNLSESEEYDAQFPNHPLSVIRKFLREVTETISNSQ